MMKNAYTHLLENARSLFAADKTHLPPLDGLRAIAIILVILLHLVFYAQYFYPNSTQSFFELPLAVKWLAKGTLGVDIFFVLSGFLIGVILLNEIKSTNHINLFLFFKKRFLRLMPVYFFFLLVMVGISPLLTDFLNTNIPLEFEHQANQHSVWTNLLYINNFFIRHDQVFGTFHTWSLAIEEQFYVLTPIILLGVFKFQMQKHIIRVLVAFLLLYFALRFAFIALGSGSIAAVTGEAMRKEINGLNILVSEINHTQFSMFYDFVYDNLYTRYIGLLLGVVAAYLYVFKLGELKSFFGKQTLSAAMLLAALFVSVFAFLEPYLLPKGLKLATLIEGNFLFSLAIAYIILVVAVPGERPPSILSRFLSLGFFAPIARISYSAYLFHVPVIFIVYSLLFHVTETPFELILLGGLVAILFTAIVAALCYIFIEQTFRVKRRSRILPEA